MECSNAPMQECKVHTFNPVRGKDHPPRSWELSFSASFCRWLRVVHASIRIGTLRFFKEYTTLDLPWPEFYLHVDDLRYYQEINKRDLRLNFRK